MPVINVLDQQTINQIAAGEVIERPASVVKELVENAIDAGASAVTVEIKDGGISFIRVTDNGCGIEKNQVPIAFLRHSTSKIKSALDLITVSSLGFRGEALSSIAAVSQVELVTRVSGELTGTRYVIWGGEEKSIEEIGAPEGTTFLVRNLFYHTPARKKFLKTPQTEAGYVSVLLERMALSRPDISFRLIVNNQTKLHSSGNHKVKDLLYQLYGREITSNLLLVRAELTGLKLSGFIGKPILARGNRNYEHYFINGRYVRSNVISKAIEDAYQGRLMQHKYPFTVLYLEIEPDRIDVNVHPTKMELRFDDNEQIYRDVYNAVTAAFAGKELIPEVKMTDSKEKAVSGHTVSGSTDTLSAENADGAKKSVSAPEPFEQNRIANLLRETGGYKTAARPEYANTGHSTGGSSTCVKSGVSVTERRPLTDLNAKIVRPVSGPIPVGEAVKHPAPSQAQSGPGLPVGQSIPTAPPSQSAKADGQQSIPGSAVTTVSAAAQPATDTPATAQPVTAQPMSAQQIADSQKEKKSTEQLSFFEEKLLTQTARMKYRFIGQLFDTYWLIQSGDELMIMDQHAAHEKVLFERFMGKLKDKKEIYSQSMNPPAIITLSAIEEELLNRHKEEFDQMGFEIEPFGGREYALYGVPADLPKIKPQDFFKDLLDRLSDCGVSESTMILETIASMSCKAAVKGNHAMSLPEAEKLVDELMTLDNPFACPHGRPTIIRMSKYELEKKFSRII
ncbi:MAG: DNA mismatch repair endonuclease MutL [Lachnospiraceae bacterium]|nr:DNA mismatch repair endonuclease MutL [Lachnospiraceae bacterium]